MKNDELYTKVKSKYQAMKISIYPHEDAFRRTDLGKYTYDLSYAFQTIQGSKFTIDFLLI